MFFQDKSKKGVSIVIGYVLLVTFAIIIGIIIYQWMKTYVPQEELNCPDDASIFIKDYAYDCDSNNLTLFLKNTGKFNLGGYFIYVTNSPDVELATIEISENNTDPNSKLTPSGIKFGLIGSTENSLNPDEIEIDEYNLTGIGRIYSVEILPIRWQKQRNKEVLVSCKDVKIKKSIECI
jgi:hypothetical protein